MIVFPAIDLMGGRVVRLRQGDPTRQTIYSDDPGATARTWLEGGVSWLHVVNLDAAFGEDDATNRQALVSILHEAGNFSAGVQLGGGLRTPELVQHSLDLGVRRVILGTLAAEHPEVLARLVETHGVGAIAASLDAKDGLVRVRGWLEGTPLRAVDLAKKLAASGLRWLVYTDVSRDGIGRGIDLNACLELAQATGGNVIAAGGVNSPQDIQAARQAGLAGIIIGRALYEGTVSINDCV